MARTSTLVAELNFDFVDHVEYNSFRALAKTFASNSGGTVHIFPNDQPSDYKGTLYLRFQNPTRNQSASIMQTIDDQIDSLPSRYARNGAEIRYTYEEIENGLH